MLRMMLRPRWVLMLVLALAVAAAFALLSQWQLARAIESGTVQKLPTEQVRPLADAAKPGSAIEETAVGQMVHTDGSWVPGDEQIVSGRLNGGAAGYWVISHLVTEDGADIPVARGWSADRAAAEEAAKQLTSADPAASVTGRLLPTEAPQVPEAGHDPHEMSTVSVAALINLWPEVGQRVYSAYIVDHSAVAGLERIDSPPPSQEVELNWLNVFYAVEWVVFAGFAIFLWYRLVRDAYNREVEEAAEAAGS